MKNKIYFLLFLIAPFVSNSQNNINLNELIGFGCYSGGSPSKTVIKFNQKLKQENYQWVTKQLDSKNNARRYMATITLERLVTLNKYELNETEMKLIAKIKKSSQLVSVCSGCTYFDKVMLKDMFTDDMLSMASNWLNYNLKTK